MKNKITLSVLIIGMALSQAVHAERESWGRGAAMGIEVEFTSIGSGIDTQTYQDIQALVTREESLKNIDFVTVKPWGREGEKTMCIQFNAWERMRAVYPDFEAVVEQEKSRITQITKLKMTNCKPPERKMASLPTSERESFGKAEMRALVLDFTSPGNGIDHDTYHEVDALIRREEKGNRFVGSTVTPWGREGERTVCVEFVNGAEMRAVYAEVEAIVAKEKQRQFQRTQLKTAPACAIKRAPIRDPQE